ncbi:MAG: ankyrin repeat domain-containing protein [Gemmatimonadales bacterium]
MSTPLPARASLDWLRKQAKRRLEHLRETRPGARLADAQLALARDHGFPSWRALKTEVERRLAARQPAAAADPGDEATGAFLRLVGTGRLAEVKAALRTLPGLVNAVGPHPFWGGRPQALHVAVEAGRRPMIALLLAAGADVSGRNDGYDHWSPLLLAIDRRRTPVVRLLRSRGAAVGLAEALALGDDRATAEALTTVRGPLPPSPNGGSLLGFARTPWAIDRLLALGAATDVRDKWGATPAEALSRLGRRGRPLARHLASRGVPVGAAEYARMGDWPALEKLAAGDPALWRNPAVIMAAVDFRHHRLANRLLDRGADPNARADFGSRHTPLHSAAWNGDVEMVRLLLARGADRALRDREHHATPLEWAETAIDVTANERCREAAAVLRAVATSTGPDDGGGAPKAGKPEPATVRLPVDDAVAEAVVAAIRAGDEPGLAALLRAEPALVTGRIVDEKGAARTLLHVATDWPGHFPNAAATIALLVRLGADPDAPLEHRAANFSAETPLHWAASSDDVVALDALLDAGANLEAPGAVFTGGTPMSDAVVFAQWQAARRLLERGARTTIWQAAALGLSAEVERYCAPEPGPSPRELSNALWHACRAGQASIARRLVRRGADPNWLGHDGKTPRAVARESGRGDLDAWLAAPED